MKPSVTLSLLAIVICFAIAVKVHKNYTVKDKLQPTATDVKLAVAMAQFKFNIDHLRAELIAKGINPDSLGK
jgi:cellobiose-specific phosphotransferase system component IIC